MKRIKVLLLLIVFIFIFYPIQSILGVDKNPVDRRKYKDKNYKYDDTDVESTSVVNTTYASLLGMLRWKINRGLGTEEFTVFIPKAMNDELKLDSDVIISDVVGLDFSLKSVSKEKLNMFRILCCKAKPTIQNTVVSYVFKIEYDESKEKEWEKAQISDILEKLDIDSYDTDEGKLKAIHDYIVNTYSYDKEFKIYDVYTMLKEKKGVCKAYTLLVNALCLEANIPAVYVRSKSHCWSLVYCDSKWYYIDCTWDDPLYINREVNDDWLTYTWFLVGQNKLDSDATHKNLLYDLRYNPEKEDKTLSYRNVCYKNGVLLFE